jgi:hypothetical protein
MKDVQKLLVEGADDLHVVSALMQHHKFPDSFKIEEKGGISEVFRILPVQLKGSNIRTLGVLIDADENAVDRWKAISTILNVAGYRDIPVAPPAEGLILENRGLPKIGVWIMPDNSLPGMLEDFVSYLVPEKDELWQIAKRVIEKIPDESKKFKDRHLCKAHIHTWLAWQEDPGTPLGLSITKKYLDAEGDSCKSFLTWISTLFEPASSTIAAW